MIQQQISLDTLTERQISEMEHFDRLAKESDIRSVLSELMSGPINSSDSYVRFALSRIMPIQGLVVLDYISGLNGNGIFLADNGALEVHSFDISLKTLEILAMALEINPAHRKMHLSHAAAEKLPYDNESFDLVYGNSALHHVDLQRAVPEIFRVLKKDGKAIFTEPLGGNSLIALVREYAPYKDKIPRTPYERPLTGADIAFINEVFPNTSVREFDFVAGFMRFFRKSGEYKLMEKIDNLLRERVPFLRDYFRYVALEMKK